MKKLENNISKRMEGLIEKVESRFERMEGRIEELVMEGRKLKENKVEEKVSCLHVILIHAQLQYLNAVYDNVSSIIMLLTLGAHARGLQYLSCLSVCLSVCLCVFSLFWHLAQSGVQTAVSATSARYGHEI